MTTKNTQSIKSKNTKPKVSKADKPVEQMHKEEIVDDSPLVEEAAEIVETEAAVEEQPPPKKETKKKASKKEVEESSNEGDSKKRKGSVLRALALLKKNEVEKAIEMLESMVNEKKEKEPRKLSDFNLFVREKMKEMSSDKTISTNQRMKLCGQMWKEQQQTVEGTK